MTSNSRYCPARAAGRQQLRPEEDCAAFAARAIDNAEREILVGAYGLTTWQLGQPVVSNGLPLTKIHHAAFDAHLIGIDPDYWPP